MQKLPVELKITPWDASQVPCSVISKALNKEKTLSVVDKVLSDNSSEGNQLVLCGSRTESEVICWKDHTPIPLPPKCDFGRGFLG